VKIFNDGSCQGEALPDACRTGRLHGSPDQASAGTPKDQLEKGFPVGQPECTVMRLRKDADLSPYAMAATCCPELPGHCGAGDALAWGLAGLPLVCECICGGERCGDPA